MARAPQKQLERMDALEGEIRDLRERMDEMAPQPFTVFITMIPKPLKLRRDIPVLIQPNGDDFVATLVDAGISATGDTDVEAIDNLKDIITQKFSLFEAMPESKLGKIPRNQLAVLRSLIAKAL